MSAAEKLVPPAPGWVLEPGEVALCRMEDPGFATVLAKARARAKGEDYRPDRHGPFDVKPLPRPARGELQTPGEAAGNLGELLGRFLEKAPAPVKQYPRPRLVDRERKDIG